MTQPVGLHRPERTNTAMQRVDDDLTLMTVNSAAHEFIRMLRKRPTMMYQVSVHVGGHFTVCSERDFIQNSSLN